MRSPQDRCDLRYILKSFCSFKVNSQVVRFTVQRSGLEKPQTARINVILASSWFQNRSTQLVMAGIPDFDQYFEQFQSVVTLEL